MVICVQPDPRIPPPTVLHCLCCWSPAGGPAELSLLGHLVQGGIVAMTWQWKGEGFRESLPLGILGHGKEEAMA